MGIATPVEGDFDLGSKSHAAFPPVIEDASVKDQVPNGMCNAILKLMYTQ